MIMIYMYHFNIFNVINLNYLLLLVFIYVMENYMDINNVLIVNLYFQKGLTMIFYLFHVFNYFIKYLYVMDIIIRFIKFFVGIVEIYVIIDLIY